MSPVTSIKLDTNSMKKKTKSKSMWRLKIRLYSYIEYSVLLKKQKIHYQISRIKWRWKHGLPEPVGTNKAAAKGKFIAMSAYISKSEKSQKSLTVQLKDLEKQENSKPKPNGWKKK